MPYVGTPQPADLVTSFYGVSPARAELYCRGMSPGLGHIGECEKAYAEAKPKYWQAPHVSPAQLEAVLDRFVELAVAAYKMPPDRQRAADALTKPGQHLRLAPNPRLAGLLDLLDQAAAEAAFNSAEKEAAE